MQANCQWIIIFPKERRLTKECVDGHECQPLGKIFFRGRHQTELINRRNTSNEDDAGNAARHQTDDLYLDALQVRTPCHRPM